MRFLGAKSVLKTKGVKVGFQVEYVSGQIRKGEEIEIGRGKSEKLFLRNRKKSKTWKRKKRSENVGSGEK